MWCRKLSCYSFLSCFHIIKPEQAIVLLSLNLAVTSQMMIMFSAYHCSVPWSQRHKCPRAFVHTTQNMTVVWWLSSEEKAKFLWDLWFLSATAEIFRSLQGKAAGMKETKTTTGRRCSFEIILKTIATVVFVPLPKHCPMINGSTIYHVNPFRI